MASSSSGSQRTPSVFFEANDYSRFNVTGFDRASELSTWRLSTSTLCVGLARASRTAFGA